MLPESMMKNPAELRRWLARAFKAAAALPPKAAKSAKTSPKKTPAEQKVAELLARHHAGEHGPNVRPAEGTCLRRTQRDRRQHAHDDQCGHPWAGERTAGRA